MKINYNKYYENIKNAKPHNLMKRIDAIEKTLPKNAIELGCGSGRDTVYLLNKRI